MLHGGDKSVRLPVSIFVTEGIEALRKIGSGCLVCCNVTDELRESWRYMSDVF